MFNYLFPIFCFGLVMTAVVFLGIYEASKQAKALDAAGPEPQAREDNSELSGTGRNHTTRFPATR